MKKTGLIVIILVLTALPLFADKISQVSLRLYRQGNHSRIVLESDSDSITESSVAASGSAIHVTFPTEFEVNKPDNFIYKTIKAGNSLTIKLKDVTDIRAARLSDPARLVFDLTVGVAQTGIGRGVPQVSPAVPAGAVQQSGKRTLKDIFQGLINKTNGKPAINTIVIDSGHGGYDYGLVTQESKEKDVDLTLAKALKAAFLKQGKTVFMTRSSDRYESITDRINFAKGKEPDLFVSIHASSSTDTFAVYVSTVKDLNVDPIIKQYSVFSAQNDYFGKSKEIALAIGESLKKEFGNTVVIRELPLPILYSMDAPAVLIEYPSLDLFGRAQSMQSKFVSSVADGISAYENQ